MKYEYSVQIVWSKEDKAYLAMIPELPGCMADGPTQEEAIKNIRVVAQEWIEIATNEGRTIPKPMSAEDHEEANRQMRKNIEDHIQKQVSEAVQSILAQLVEQSEQQAWLGSESWSRKLIVHAGD